MTIIYKASVSRLFKEIQEVTCDYMQCDLLYIVGFVHLTNENKKKGATFRSSGI
jgi:hypothetical protein